MNYIFIESIKNEYLLFEIVTKNGRVLTYRVDIQGNLSIQPQPMGNVKTNKIIDKDVMILINKVTDWVHNVECFLKSVNQFEFFEQDIIFKPFRFKKYKSIKGLVNFANNLTAR